LPGFDRAFSGLIQDLDNRGLLNDTLVLVMSEMGRTPKLEGDGRGHWGYAHTNLFAGAGVKRGNVIGKTDAIGARVKERPVTAKDVLATIYHLLGVDPQTTFTDRRGRPVPLVPYGDVIREMLGSS
jgi:arylsulfatase A-like enzyme